jgi:MFS family permease
LMMQFSGIDATFYYSTSVFRHADVSDPELATTCLGVINVLVTIVAVKYMDSAGRKTLLQYSWIGMCTSYLILTLSFIFKPVFDNMDEISVVATTGVIIFFAFGPGCIAWYVLSLLCCLMSFISAVVDLFKRDIFTHFIVSSLLFRRFIIAEIFPLSARDIAMAIGISVNWIANWLVAFSFPILLEYTHPYTFLLFAATTGFFLYFTNKFVPETKGLTICEVTQKFNLLKLG